MKNINRKNEKIEGVNRSLIILCCLIVFVFIILFISYSPCFICMKINKILVGDIFLGIGGGVMGGLIYAFSIKKQTTIFSIYALAGLVCLITGSILRNL